MTYINGHGGWMLVGWTMKGEHTDVANPNEKVENYTTTVHLSYLYPMTLHFLALLHSTIFRSRKTNQPKLTLRMAAMGLTKVKVRTMAQELPKDKVSQCDDIFASALNTKQSLVCLTKHQ